jgi:WD40 repeat protein
MLLSLNAFAGREVCFSSDGRRILGGASGALDLWDATTGQHVATLRGHTGQIGAIAISPDGRRLAAGSGDGTVRILDSASELAGFSYGRTTPIAGVGFSRDGKHVVVQITAVSPNTPGHIFSYDATTGQVIDPSNDGPPPAGQREAVHPDGKLRIKAEDYMVRLYRSGADEPTPEQQAEEEQTKRRRGFLWHRREAEDSEKAGQWFAAAFHLRQLIAARETSADQLKERLKRCEDRLRQP